jgi:hypothetical protein
MAALVLASSGLVTPASAGLFGLGLPGGGPASAPQRFDLDCLLQHTVKRRHVNVHRHLRIDLAQKRWCEDLCEVVGGLKDDGDTLDLAAEPSPMGPATLNRQITLNRKSGRLRDEQRVMMEEDVVSVDLYYGQCRLRPYTGVDRRMF